MATIQKEVEIDLETDEIIELALEELGAKDIEGLLVQAFEQNGDEYSARRLLNMAGACLETAANLHDEHHAVAEWLAHEFGEACNPEQQMRMAKDMVRDINVDELVVHLTDVMRQLTETQLIEVQQHAMNILEEKAKKTAELAAMLNVTPEDAGQRLSGEATP